MRDLKHLRKIFISRKEYEKKLLLLISDQGISVRHIWGLEYDNVTYALHSMYIENKIEAVKSYLYTASMLRKFAYVKFGSSPLNNIYGLAYALFSDDERLIAEYINLIKTIDASNVFEHIYLISRMIVCVLDKTPEDLLPFIEEFQRLDPFEGDFTAYECFTTIFLGIFKNDVKMFQQGVMALFNSHKDRYSAALSEHYLSFEGTLMVKLGERIGFPFPDEHEYLERRLVSVSTSVNYIAPYEWLI